ncbi:MAG: zinc dependent phospholipase C family protein [Eubacteriales bacterium]|nr:zinc dependent phospholipase C family protein [Eubacteriales bacterium]
MRKKSHLALASFLVQGMGNETLSRRWRSFYMGNILPDCKPSFVTVRHEYDGTFDMMAEMLRRLVEQEGYWSTDSARYIMDLGQVFHYIADYFTFPHNTNFDGNIKDHCTYENRLKHGLRAYISSGEAAFRVEYGRRMDSADDILDYIREAHEEYMRKPSSVERDCRYITAVTSQVLLAIPQLAGVPVMAYAG